MAKLTDTVEFGTNIRNMTINEAAQIAEGWSEYVKGKRDAGECSEEEYKINHGAALTIANKIRAMGAPK